eukprot:gene3882-15183_t
MANRSQHGKTEVMLISNTRDITTYCKDNIRLIQVTRFKYLGVTLRVEVQWQQRGQEVAAAKNKNENAARDQVFDLKERQRNESIRRDCGVENITTVIRRSRLSFFGNDLRIQPGDKRTLNLEVERRRPRVRPVRKRMDNIKKGMEALGIREVDVLDRER